MRGRISPVNILNIFLAAFILYNFIQMPQKVNLFFGLSFILSLVLSWVLSQLVFSMPRFLKSLSRSEKFIFLFCSLFTAIGVIVEWPGFVSSLGVYGALMRSELPGSSAYAALVQAMIYLTGHPFGILLFNFATYAMIVTLVLTSVRLPLNRVHSWLLIFILVGPQTQLLVIYLKPDSTFALLLTFLLLGFIQKKLIKAATLFLISGFLIFATFERISSMADLGRLLDYEKFFNVSQRSPFIVDALKSDSGNGVNEIMGFYKMEFKPEFKSWPAELHSQYIQSFFNQSPQTLGLIFNSCLFPLLFLSLLAFFFRSKPRFSISALALLGYTVILVVWLPSFSLSTLYALFLAGWLIPLSLYSLENEKSGQKAFVFLIPFLQAVVKWVKALKKSRRIVGVNFIIFLTLVGLVELFFTANSAWKLITPGNWSVPTVDDSEVLSQYKIDMTELSTMPWIYPKIDAPELLGKTSDDIDYTNKFGPSTPVLSTGPIRYYDDTGFIKLRNSDFKIYEIGLRYMFDQGHQNTIRKSDYMKAYAKKFIIHFGDSFIFGEGVDQGFTLASQLNKKTNEYNNYNFGVPGLGPNDMYFNLKDDDRKKYVDEKEGILIYHYLFFHANRVLCSLRCISDPNHNQLIKPEYELEGQEFFLKHVHFTDRPPISIFESYFLKSETLKFFNLDWPIRFNSQDFELILRLIDGVFKTYEKKFAVNAKYIVLHPLVGQHEGQLIKELAPKFGIKVLDYSKMNTYSLLDKRQQIPLDNHPTSYYNNFMAQVLAQDLGFKK